MADLVGKVNIVNMVASRDFDKNRNLVRGTPSNYNIVAVATGLLLDHTGQAVQTILIDSFLATNMVVNSIIDISFDFIMVASIIEEHALNFSCIKFTVSCLYLPMTYSDRSGILNSLHCFYLYKLSAYGLKKQNLLFD